MKDAGKELICYDCGSSCVGEKSPPTVEDMQKHLNTLWDCIHRIDSKLDPLVSEFRTLQSQCKVFFQDERGVRPDVDRLAQQVAELYKRFDIIMRMLTDERQDSGNTKTLSGNDRGGCGVHHPRGDRVRLSSDDGEPVRAGNEGDG